VREVQAEVWHWEAPHPEWKPGEEWDKLVSSYAIDDGTRLLPFDPIAPPPEIEALAIERETAIVLTCPWHRRDAEGFAERLGTTVYVPPPDEGDASPVEGHVFRAGEELPVGVVGYEGMEPNDLLLWVESHRVLVAGDTLIIRGEGLELPADWIGASLEEVRERVRPILELPVELVLATHGGSTDRAALERALA